MAVFGNYIVENSGMGYESFLPDVDAESLMMDESVEPCQEDNFLVAGARICAECTENMNRIMEACAIQEFCYFEENGTEMVYEGGAITSFIEKAKSFFMKLWQKIQGIFKKAIMIFSSKAKEDKDFVSKYKTELNKAKHGDYGDAEVSIYKYIFYTKSIDMSGATVAAVGDRDQFVDNSYKPVLDAAGLKADQVISDVARLEGMDTVDESDSDTKALLDRLRDASSTLSESDWKDDVKDKVRGQLIAALAGGSAEDVSASEFNKEIAEACQGDSTKDSVGLSEAVNYAVPYLENSKNIIKALDKWLKAWKKGIDNEIRALNNAAKNFDKLTGKKDTKAGAGRAAGYKHTCLSTAIGLDEARKTIGVTFHSAVINQIKACSGQSKAICVQAVHYKKPKHKSYAYTEESTGSLLDNVELL